jgi:tetratricopeptide (TPR) repeat protein
VFLRPALRTVQLDGITQPVAVHPRWEFYEEWNDDVFENQRREILQRDLAATPVEDLVYALKIADHIKDHKLMAHFGDTSLRRQKEFTSDVAELFLRLGTHYQHYEVRAYDRAEAAYRAALVLNPQLQARGKLRLARFLLEYAGKADEAGRLLDEIDPGTLDGDEKRMRLIAQGNVSLAHGDVEGARAKFRGAGDLVNRLDERYAVARRARLQSAVDYLRRQEWDAADQLLRQMVWEAPQERLAPETGMAMLRVYLGRQELLPALALAERLIPVPKNDNLQADLLFHLVEIQRALNLTRDAGETLAKLLAQHPYSEAAARAKERWRQ